MRRMRQHNLCLPFLATSALQAPTTASALLSVLLRTSMLTRLVSGAFIVASLLICLLGLENFIEELYDTFELFVYFCITKYFIPNILKLIKLFNELMKTILILQLFKYCTLRDCFCLKTTFDF